MLIDASVAKELAELVNSTQFVDKTFNSTGASSINIGIDPYWIQQYQYPYHSCYTHTLSYYSIKELAMELSNRIKSESDEKSALKKLLQDIKDKL